MSGSAAKTPWTVARLLTWTREYFERHSIDAPRLCAEILLAHALRCERIELYTRYESVPDDQVLSAFRDAVRQAAAGRPIAYLTGSKEFFSLTFKVTPDVLIPRPETEVLVERVIDLARRSGEPIRHILDIGTGSGCIAISLAKNLADARLVATDISEAALAVARRNADRHGVAERIEFLGGDVFDGWSVDEPFDVIASNPPYVSQAEMDELPANVRDHEPHVALCAGPAGLDIMQRVVAGAAQRLRPGGHLMIEVAYNQAGPASTLLDGSLWRDIVTYRDGLGHQRVVHARLRSADRTPAV